jgi:hypothetical protein
MIGMAAIEASARLVSAAAVSAPASLVPVSVIALLSLESVVCGVVVASVVAELSPPQLPWAAATTNNSARKGYR